jgi:hypothetical protein
LTALGVHDLKAYEETGTFEGLALQGSFHEWKDENRDLRDEQLGVRRSSTLRIGDRIWVKDDNGAVRELLGIEKRRQLTEDFIGSSDFVDEPKYSSYAGVGVLPDGRDVYYVDTTPKGGEPYRVAIDANSWLIVQTSYADVDGNSTATLSDLRVIGGELIPGVEVDSNGDAAYDVTGRVTSFTPKNGLPVALFSPLVPDDVTTDKPVTVHFDERNSLIVVPVQIAGKTYHFLLDSGSQTDVLDVHLVDALGLHGEGILEVSGAKRTASGGTVEGPPMSIGGVTLPMRIATVLDLSGMLAGTHIDGMIGYPLFAAADVRIDPAARTLTLATPGTLTSSGARLDVDTDRELCDVNVRLEGEPARVLFDTGNANELLVFESFIDSHQGLLSMVTGDEARGTGIGGSITARELTIDDLTIGPYHLYNRNAVVILAQRGAFADRNDGGNVGYGVLQNFVMTFSLPSHELYIEPASTFDDGRFRVVR